MSVILSPFPQETPDLPEPWTPRPRPTSAHLVADTLVRRASQPPEAIRALRSFIGDSETRRDVTEKLASIVEAFAPALSPVSPTPFNVEIGPHRRFDWTQMKVADLKAVKNVLGGTLNDVVLATVAGALHTFFKKRRVDPEELEVRAMVPVSVRSQDERGALGNRVTQLTVPLPVNLSDPVKRLRAVRRTTADLKESKQALGGEVLTAISEWTVPNLLVQAVRLAARTRPYTLVVTNVPGPQIPLFLLGSFMQTSYPVVPLFDHMGVSVGLFSYNGGLFWGLNADWETIPDLHDFVVAMESAFRELQAAAAEEAAKPAKPAARKGRPGAQVAS